MTSSPAATVRARLRGVAASAVVRAADRLGMDTVPRHFYSPLPDVAAMDAASLAAPSPMTGLAMDLETQFGWIEDVLAPHIAEFHGALAGADPVTRFRLDNPTFGPVDADLLYAVIRAQRPRRVVELGSGSSSHVLDMAVRRNHADGLATEYAILDPYPWSESGLPPVASRPVETLSATDVPLGRFDDLDDGDVLFVDTSHTVKTGGDVNRIVLEVLPRLRAGVMVHFHDIFLPRDYPWSWVAGLRRAWAEQYLVHAFLLFNDRFAISAAANALWAADPERLERSVPGAAGLSGAGPGSFWIRRTPG